MKLKKILLLSILSLSFLSANSNINLLLNTFNLNNKKFIGYETNSIKIKDKKPKTIIKIKKIIKNNIIIPPSIYFNFNSSKLTKISKRKLLNFIKELKKVNKNYLIILYGYADYPGTDKYNIKISKNRVEEVKNFLVKNGISNNKIKIFYIGNKILLINKKTKEKLNRRVDIQIVFIQ